MDDDGNTPLDEDEVKGLIPTHVSTHGELNEFEHANIVDGEQWTRAQPPSRVLMPDFIRAVHRRMFDRTWRWAGQFRTSEKNVGIHWAEIPMATQNLCEDTRVQLDEAVFPVDEIAARFHHQLTHIHPFPNGNGRHARVMTDKLLLANGRKPFLWGRGDLRDAGDTRAKYIAALQAADAHDYEPLFEFLNLDGRRPG